LPVGSELESPLSLFTVNSNVRGSVHEGHDILSVLSAKSIKHALQNTWLQDVT